MQKKDINAKIVKFCLFGSLFIIFGCSTDQYDYVDRKYQEPEPIKVQILLKDTRKNEKSLKSAVENAPSTSVPAANNGYSQNNPAVKNTTPMLPNNGYGIGNNGLDIKANGFSPNSYARNRNPMMSNNAFNIKTNVYAQTGYGNRGYGNNYGNNSYGYGNNGYDSSNISNIPSQCLGGAQAQLPMCAQYFTAGDPVAAAGPVDATVGAPGPGGVGPVDAGFVGGPGGVGPIDPGFVGPGFAGIDPGLYGGLPFPGIGIAPGVPYPGLEFAVPGFPIVDDLLFWEDDRFYGDYGYDRFDDDDYPYDRCQKKHCKKKRCDKKNDCSCKKKKHPKKDKPQGKKPHLR